MMGSTTLRHVHSPESNDAIDDLAHCLALIEATEITVMMFVCEITQVLKVLAVKEHHLPYSRFLNQIPWPC